jgi:RHS repeat-associated protein
MKGFNFACSLIILLLSLSGLGFGQGEGVPPFSTMQPNQFDTINLANDNVLIEIPVRSKAGPIPLSISLAGNSNVKKNANFWASNFTLSPQSPVSFILRYSAVDNQAVCPDLSITTVYTGWYSLDGLLTRHDFVDANGDPVQIDTKGCLYPTASGFTNDGSGYTAHLIGGPAGVSGTLSDIHGNTITPVMFSNIASSIVDTNGNQISKSIGGIYTDSLGQVALTAVIGQVANPDTYSYTDVNGASKTITVSKSTFVQKTNFACSGMVDINTATVYLPTGVSFPDGSSMAFTYEPTPGTPADVTGRIKTITLPTGGVITFAYSGGNNGINCVDGTIPTLTRSTSDGTWTYVHNPPAQIGATSTTTVTDPSTSVTVHTFSGLYETNRLSYQGSTTLLKTQLTCYDGNFTNCVSAQVSPPITQKDVYRYLPSNVNPGSLSETKYVANTGLLLEDKEYDFGPTLVNDAVIVYGSFNGGNCVAAASADRPCTTTTKDSAGNTVAQTRYTYDSDGNPTQIQRLVSGTTYLTENFGYDANGAVNSHTDVNGTPTTYINGACNGAFPTVISGSGLSTSAVWDCNGAVRTSFTDANNQPIAYSYNDPLWRLKSTTDPLSNVTTMTYVTGASSYVKSSMPFNGTSSTIDITNFLDGLGRPKRIQQRKSPTGTTYDTETFTYDTNGQLFKSTRPCTVAWATDCGLTPAKTTTYDALGRVLTTTDGGGGTITFSYTRNDVLQTVGPTTPVKVKQFEYDGLGRLKSVCEVTTGAGSGTCGQNVTKTGYWTKYTYNALGKLTSVAQNAQGTSQTRTYAYDDLGRLTAETNPESGTIQYFYDFAPSSPGVACSGTTDGDLLKTYDTNGNTTCYTYDGLHRVLSTTYSGPNSTGVNKYFVYDSAVVNGQQMANAQGRLAEPYTATTQTGSKITDLGFSYSPRGEQTDVYELTPHSGGFYHVVQSFWANGNLKTLSGLGLPTITYNVNGQGQTSTVNASTGTNPVSSTSYNASGQVTGVTFGSLDTAAFSFDNNTGRMTQYKETINGSATFGTIGWNANGTPSSLAITDPFNALNGGKTCTFGYDDLIRVSSTSCTGSIWSQTFTYDPFGNITKTGNSAWNPGYNSATNHYTLGGTSYDANGNLLNDTFHTYTWNSDGQVLSVDSTGLTYDALGHQVERTNGAGYVQYVYAGSAKLALMNGQTLTRAFVPLPGGTQGVYTTSFSKYRVPDWLGSFRIESTSSRTWGWSAAFAPFGERYAEGGSAAAKTFAGHNWDTVNDLYDALFREQSGAQGRWISPDPVGVSAVDISDPRSWNRYAYTLNNPLIAIDPLGLDCVYLNDSGDAPESIDHNSVPGECSDNGGQWLVGSIQDGSVGANPDTGQVWGSNSDGFVVTNDPGDSVTVTANPCSTNGLHGGIGISFGGSADLSPGGPAFGAMSTASAGGGLFFNRTSISAGGFASGGAAVFGGPFATGVPDQTQGTTLAAGAYGGAGPSVFVTNARSVQQLKGPFATYTLNVGAGPVKFSAQFSTANGIWQASVGPPLPYVSAGVGASFSKMTTNTFTTSTGCD